MHPNAFSCEGKESMSVCHPYSQDLQCEVQVQITLLIKEGRILV
jgi:hypothetical protein